MVSTVVAAIFIFIATALDFNTCSSEWEMPRLKMENVLIAFGTIFFTYGGHVTFPIIQHDMKKPSDFKKSIILAFSSK